LANGKGARPYKTTLSMAACSVIVERSVVKPKDDTIDYVLSQIREGRSLREACADVEISRSTFWNWCDADPLLAGRYTLARASQLDAWADELIQPVRVYDAVDVAAVKIRHDNMKWLLARLRPERYSEKTKHEHTGADGGPIQQHTTHQLVDEQVAGGLDALRAITGGTDPARAGKARH
jgi:hypothetical protein